MGRGGEQTVAQVEELVVGSDLGACRSGREALEHVRGLAQQEHGHAAQVQHGRPHHQLLLCQALLLIIIIVVILIIFIVILIVVISGSGNFAELGHGVLDLLGPQLDLLHHDFLSTMERRENHKDRERDGEREHKPCHRVSWR